VATLSSYLGHLKRANGWHLWPSLWGRFGWLAPYVAFDAVRWPLVRCCPMPQGFRRVRDQYGYFRGRFPGDVLFFQVGRFCERYGADDGEVARWLGLAPTDAKRRGARDGFPVRQMRRHLGALLGRGLAVTWIREPDDYRTRIERRLPARRWCVASAPS
jgi:hypothetical protein